MNAGELRRLHYDWPLWAREDQLAPGAAQGGGDWTTWLMLGGRGAGKTRAGAEWVRSIAEAPREACQQPPRIALIGETFADARNVMVEGVSGLLAVHPPEMRPLFEATKQRVTWPNGAVAQLFSAEDPEALRGPQFDAAWADELAKWRRPQDTWDMLQFGLRLGERPRQVVTTTPRPVPLIKALLADETCAVTRVATAANAINLAPRFLEAIVGKYRGTRLGRQELMAELLEDRPDALWPRALIEKARVNETPDLRRIVVAVDPPVTSGGKADACGIVVAGVSADGLGFVLKDRTVQGLSPAGWAKAALAAYHNGDADCIVAEVNQGGELVEAVLRQVDRSVPVRSVRASRGKFVRAEPVAALYEQGRVFHVGSLAELEDEMSDFGPDGLSGGRSPDRVDALVWALTALMLQGGAEPRVRGL
ncbi:Terminase-like family protein [Methyloligella halotolerans]|uniref:Terminase-like family protein n=1 Tax=Methyloligella halotolerans TaxID=1177755 RepID=A0A1E2RXK3_9HYPH|nr:Terminase-like family protein [Methyloligella halotolerans]